MKTSKAAKFYGRMRAEAIRGYAHYGNWNWTITQHWGEDETKNVINAVGKLVKRRLAELDVERSLGIRNRESYNKELEINEQVLKFVNERKQILRGI